MTIFHLPCLIVSVLLSLSSHASLRTDTIVGVDSIPPLLTEPALRHLLVFAEHIKDGKEHDAAQGKHCNSLLRTRDTTDVTYELIPVSIPVRGAITHFKLHRVNITAAAAHDSTVAAALKDAALTSEQVQSILLSLWTAEITIHSNSAGALESISPAQAATVPWRNVQFVQAHPGELSKLYWESGLSIGYGDGIGKGFTGIYRQCNE